MSSDPIQDLDVLKDLYDESGVEFNLKYLAKMLGVQDKELAKALGMQETAFSRKPYAPKNPVLSQWQSIFHMIIQIFHDAQPELSPEEIKLKMQRWLRLARPEFNNKTPIEYMLSGKGRHVTNLLEQLSE